jgi:N-methylhydantoinase A
VAAADVERNLYAQMCYPGQNFDMSVPIPEGIALDEPGLLDLAERFHDQHQTERGFCFRSQQPLMRGVRVIARGTTPKPDHLAETGALADATQARRGTRSAYWGDGFVDTPVYDGTRLGEGATVIGPALIEEPFTVVVLPPDATTSLDGLGNYVISV